MNIFILNSGRCGSSTFIKACQHITNYTSAHESLLTEVGEKRLNYPENHIEADNRLSWLLGRLDEKFGDDAYYVYLSRNKTDVVNSFCKRLNFGILKAYEQGVLMHEKHMLPADEIASDYIETIDSNINFGAVPDNALNVLSEAVCKRVD
jgi:hypothetical protein